MTEDPFHCRLYLITPPRIDDVPAFADTLARTLGAGDVGCLQLRLKQADGVRIDEAATRAVAEIALPIAQEHGVAMLINDSVEIAQETGADGVHLGRTDPPVRATRELLGPDAIIGATCHDSRHYGMQAGEEGADYVAFGAFYPTQTKDYGFRPELDLLTWWQEVMALPCVAIGGITPENAAPLVKAGADFIAVVTGVWNHPDGPEAAIIAYNKAIEEAAG